jgi:hypothetical protein
MSKHFRGYNMKTFKQWAEENKLELPIVTDTTEKTDKTTDENRVRTGWSANYPPAYFSAQYPHKYVNPHKATADLDAQIMDKGEVPLKVKN